MKVQLGVHVNVEGTAFVSISHHNWATLFCDLLAEPSPPKSTTGLDVDPHVCSEVERVKIQQQVCEGM